MKKVREQTLFLYYLILGSFKFKNDDIKLLNPYIDRPETEKSDKELIEEISEWINDIIDYCIIKKDSVLMFNLYDKKGYGWNLQLTFLENYETDQYGLFENELYSSGKNLFKWKSTLNEKEAQKYAVYMINSYLSSAQVHEKISTFNSIGVWSRYGTIICGI